MLPVSGRPGGAVARIHRPVDGVEERAQLLAPRGCDRFEPGYAALQVRAKVGLPLPVLAGSAVASRVRQHGLQAVVVLTREGLFGGMGLDSQWDRGCLGRVRDTLFAPSDDGRHASSIAEAVGKSYNRSGPFARVVYTESHV